MKNSVECIPEPETKSIKETLEYYGYELSGRKTVALPGDPSIGKVTYIKQIHKVAETAHLMTREQREALIRYQREIYMELKRSRAKHIFAEGIRPEDLEIYKESEFREIAKRMKNPSLMREMLINYGGAILYAAENPKERILHATEDHDIMERSLDYLAMHDCLSPTIMEERETHVAKLLADFFRNNRGQEAHLVYGAGHTFHDNLRKVYEGSRPPLQENIGFTNLARSIFLADERALTGAKKRDDTSSRKDTEIPFGFPPPRR